MKTIAKGILLGGAMGCLYVILASFAMEKTTAFGYLFQFLLYPPYYLLKLFCLASLKKCPANDFGDLFLMAFLVIITGMILGGILRYIRHKNTVPM